MEKRDYFDDLNLVDQFIPLEQLEYSLTPYDSNLNNLNIKYEQYDNLWKIESLNEFHTNQSLCTESNESNLSANSSYNQVKLNKYPEPYAIMIVKAILSREENVMQLKDIYNYFMTNYEIFSMEPDSAKWKNSIRHNLSRHKYFIKTSEKNAQGHYWSIDPDYLVYFKQGIYECKTLVKQAKLKRQASLGVTKTKRTKKTRTKLGKENTNSTPQSNHYNYNLIQQSSSYYNDSAYLSNNETTDNSFNNYYISNLNNSPIY